MKNTYIKSPLNYVGGKYKLLPQIIPLFPDDIDTFVDLFGGGFNVGINVNAKNIVYNDVEPHVVELLHGLYKSNYDDVHATICQIIDEYGLSRSDVHGYEFYGCESNNGLGQYNKEKYYKLRADYNQNPTWIKFYTLITCAFSNQIRFNSKGESLICRMASVTTTNPYSQNCKYLWKQCTKRILRLVIAIFAI